MLKVDAITFFGSKTKLANAAGVRLASVAAGGYWFLKVARCVYRRHLAGSFSMIPKFMMNIVRRSGRGG